MRYDENKCETIKMAGCNPAQYMSRFGKTQNSDRHINDGYWLSGGTPCEGLAYDQGWTGDEEDERCGQGRQEAALRQRS